MRSRKTILALVDCNNFYVSCELVFRPGLRKRPVVVLSNNDGCVVSRSEEAKALGIGMGVPFFRVRALLEERGGLSFSSNYALYGDMSRRVMSILTEYASGIEIYSIDEAFLDISGGEHGSLTAAGLTIRSHVMSWTGIPVSVGIAGTKTLAKVANRVAKKRGGVFDLTDPRRQKGVLAEIGTEDIWGIGPASSARLRRHGIINAGQFRDAEPGLVKRLLGLNGLRTLYELRGVPCYELIRTPPPKKMITVSRSFRSGIKTRAGLLERVAAYVGRGAERLRREGSAAAAVSVFLTTSRFQRETYYGNIRTIHLPAATSNTSALIRSARRALAEIYRPGCLYKKAGVILGELRPERELQGSLLEPERRDRSRRLMAAVDGVNRRLGADTLRCASSGLSLRPSWKSASNRSSPAYTTDWRELALVN